MAKAKPVKFEEMPPFEEAVNYFLDKKMMTRPEFDALSNEMRTRAFTVAGQFNAEALQTTHNAVSKAIKDGDTLRDFQKQTDHLLFNSDWHQETVFRTNIQSAHGAGHWAQAQDTKAMRPYAIYTTIIDGRERITHAALNGKVYPIDSPFWSMYWPPWGYNCRCQAVTLSQGEVDQAGLEVNKILTSDLPPLRPDFSSPVNGIGKWHPDLMKFSPDIAHAVAEDILATEIGAAAVTEAIGGETAEQKLEALRKAIKTSDPETIKAFGRAFLDNGYSDIVSEWETLSNKLYYSKDSAQKWSLRTQAKSAGVDFLDRFAQTSVKKGLTEGVDYRGFPKKIFETRTKNDLSEFYRITGVKKLNLDYFNWEGGTTSRSFASIRSSMTRLDGHVGLAAHQVNSETIFHELGHFVEFTNPKARAAANKYLESRNIGTKPVPLKELTGRNYKSSEVAYKTTFYNKYAGKVYASGSTEIISMGLENFTDGRKLFEFFQKDRDYFEFIIGLLKSGMV